MVEVEHSEEINQSESKPKNSESVVKKRYKIIYEREGCIGAAACAAVHPDLWTMDEAEDGKADIKKERKPKKLDNSDQEIEITEEEYQIALESAQSCPVNVIHIIDLETGRKII